MKASTKRTIMTLLSLIFLIASVYIYAVFIKPSYVDILELASMRVGRQENVRNFSALNEEFQQILNEYKNIDEWEEKISIFIRPEIDLSYAINQITGIARLNNIDIQSFSLKPVAIKPTKTFVKGMGILRTELKMSGIYENFKSFLKNIETNFLIADVVNFKIDVQSNSQNLTIIATIDTYYQTK